MVEHSLTRNVAYHPHVSGSHLISLEAPMKKSSATWLGLVLAIATTAAQGAMSDGLARPLAGGIVFPSLYSSIETNPAGLLHDSKSVVGADWQIPVQGTTSSAVTEGVAGGGKYFGAGALIGSSAVGNVVTLNRATAAFAVGMPGS